ncbi:hypothetical protein [Aquimarina sp. 2201CG14-23]|uniref:hypothetical protein n=1 Tax=Aquimarina mycalae TaxID=3040073 RepID=UPI0024781645|nr:hypothetical protein [Aquimarina sp. 2201CG14-23]MDH7448443.1 hypothetical protein [Aquimarina sp. 2201CG14-23]
MKHSLLVFSLFISIFSFGQKIKIKKGEVFVDKVKVGHIEKIKAKGLRHFQVTDNDNNPLFKAGDLKEPSLLFHSDKSYPYNAFFGDQLKDTLLINSKHHYFLSKKKIFQLAIEMGFFTTEGFQESKADELLAQTPKRPERIIKKLDKERRLLDGKGHRVDRDFNDMDIHLISYPSKKAHSQLNKSMVDQVNYDIYIGDPNIEEGDHTLIGSAVREIGTVSGEYFFIFNTKKFPLASYHSMTFKIYGNKKELGIMDHDIKVSMGSKRSEAIKEMARELIKRGKL